MRTIGEGGCDDGADETPMEMNDDEVLIGLRSGVRGDDMLIGVGGTEEGWFRILRLIFGRLRAKVRWGLLGVGSRGRGETVEDRLEFDSA